MPRAGPRHLVIEFLQPLAEIVVVVVGLDLVERTLELTLASFQFLKHRFHRPPRLGDFTDLLAQGLLTAADLFQPLLHVDRLVASSLRRRARLGLSDLAVEGGNGFLGIAAQKMLDGCVEILLFRAGDHDRSLQAAPTAAP